MTHSDRLLCTKSRTEISELQGKKTSRLQWQMSPIYDVSLIGAGVSRSSTVSQRSALARMVKFLSRISESGCVALQKYSPKIVSLTKMLPGSIAVLAIGWCREQGCMLQCMSRWNPFESWRLAAPELAGSEVISDLRPRVDNFRKR